MMQEKLESKFLSAYCAWNLLCSVENDIACLIRQSLPDELSDKISTISIEDDPDGFLQIVLFVLKKDINDLKIALSTAFPYFIWEVYDDPNFCRIYLRLDCDVLPSLI